MKDVEAELACGLIYSGRVGVCPTTYPPLRTVRAINAHDSPAQHGSDSETDAANLEY